MKHTFVLLLTFAFFNSIILSQWNLQNPKIQAERLTCIVTADSTTAYCGGYFGRIMKSTDKGDTWEVLKTGICEIIVKLFFVNSKTGWAVTYDSNKLYKTNDGGASWQVISKINYSGMIPDIAFINDSTGYFTGGYNSMMHTHNGGIIWDTLNITNTIWSGTSSIYFPDEKNGFVAVNSSKLYKTSDYGNTWQNTNADYSFCNISKIFALDSLRLFVVGSETVYDHQSGFLTISSGGGKYWHKTYFDKPVQDVYFKNTIDGAVIKESKIMLTTDGGFNWVETNIPASAIAFFNDDTTALAVGGSNMIRRTKNFWKSYTNVTPSVATSCLNSVSPLDSLNVVACGDNGTIVITSDGGKSWESINTFHSPNLSDILYLDKHNILACGESYVLNSSDGGNIWYKDSLNASWLSDIEYVNDTLIYAAGSDFGTAVLFSSKDKGNTWKSLKIFESSTTIEKVKFSNKNLGWLIFNNKIYKTTDSGFSWKEIQGVNTSSMAGATKGDTAWFTCMNSVLITTDAGISWNQYKMFDYGNTIFSTYCISMKNSLEGTVGLYDGRIYETDDGGKSWTNVEQLTSMPIYDLKYVNDNTAWAVGDGGLILKYSETKTDVKNTNQTEVQYSFRLAQNYPNPFNPNTTIQFSIPVVQTMHASSVHVTLKVYDVLGREVATLVNDEKPAGSYSVTFNVETLHGASLPSGVYFYKLTAGEYIQTKKMILIK
jgi:photosystem II stability/assembly factor-like uncharacterized protein